MARTKHPARWTDGAPIKTIKKPRIEPRTEDVTRDVDMRVIVGWVDGDDAGFQLVHVESWTLHATDTPRLTEGDVLIQLEAIKARGSIAIGPDYDMTMVEMVLDGVVDKARYGDKDKDDEQEAENSGSEGASENKEDSVTVRIGELGLCVRLLGTHAVGQRQQDHPQTGRAGGTCFS